MGKIDDPAEASLDAWPDKPEGWAEIGVDLALSFGGLIFPPAQIAKILKDRFFQPDRIDRVMFLFETMASKLRSIEANQANARELIKEMESQLKTPRLQEAVASACEESVRATNHANIERLAAIVTGSLKPNIWRAKDEDLASFIRDIAQLNDRDIDVLQKLSVAFGGIMLQYEKLGAKVNSKHFTDNSAALEQIIRNEPDPDDFYSTCGRLLGFGLAIEETWPMPRTQSHERCFRPTRRGLALLSYLSKFARS